MRELDEAVARAVGFEHRPGQWWHPEAQDFIGPCPTFSESWNWAMWAAEKAGLLSDKDFEVAWDGESREWVVSQFNSGSGPCTRIIQSDAPTGPEAICRAILRGKGVDFSPHSLNT